MSWYFYFYLKNLLRSLLFEAENRFTYWDTGGKRDLDLGLAPGECLVSKTGVTCFFQTMWGWSRSAVWHVGLSHTTKHRTMLQQKLLGSPNPVPDQQSQSAGVYDTDISAPSDAAKCPASSRSEAEVLLKSHCQFEIVLVGQVPWAFWHTECVKITLCSWKNEEVCFFPFTQGILSRAFFSLSCWCWFISYLFPYSCPLRFI